MTDQTLDPGAVIERLTREATGDVILALAAPLVAEKVQQLARELERERKDLRKALPALQIDVDAKGAELGRREAEMLRLRGELAQAVPDVMRATSDQLALHGRLTTELAKATGAWQSCRAQPDLARRKVERVQARIAEIDALLSELRSYSVPSESRRIRDLVLS